eukprot:m.152617 g.152617  ORF g.152617 m.152617 type:complete len:71 (-) comp17893_c0_seq37:1164-1376(-)
MFHGILAEGEIFSVTRRVSAILITEDGHESSKSTNSDVVEETASPSVGHGLLQYCRHRCIAESSINYHDI